MSDKMKKASVIANQFDIMNFDGEEDVLQQRASI